MGTRAATSTADEIIPKMAMQKPVAICLLVCCALVFAIVVVGGVTRLTDSGLSIVEWKPILGTIPPFSESDWEEIFEKYHKTPQYKKINQGMSPDEFKNIFWWEYFHRLLGRVIGLVFLIPFLYFSLRKRIDRPLGLKLAGIFLLGGLQGLMCWYIVKSGWGEKPHVSQYRLTAHLSLAFIIFAAMFHVALKLLIPTGTLHEDKRIHSLYRFSQVIIGLIFLMVLSGGFVAGIRAGLAYNTFPLMNGHFIPPEIFTMEPWYRNFFDNMATVQFDHRIIAWILAILVPIFWFKSRRFTLPSSTHFACNLLLFMLIVQISLGVATLLMAVPLPLAVAHQAGAMLLFTAALWVNHKLR